ncbi:unnamed protein product [Arctia plantaginis]|uniref:Chemosensory protein n=1 Tax=Arctia plantaginis TaxID=874455 RepID=A0A8S0ZIX5_ARCPL|nr:unnamed protein product [Arctia plantaginis]
MLNIRMKSVFVLCVLIAAVFCRPETYDSRYDDFDVQSLVGNIRLLKAYGNCFLGKGPCTPEGSDFKKTIPDALRTSCKKCSPKQRELIRTVVKTFQKETPQLWQELVMKEDPNGEYKEDFTRFINGRRVDYLNKMKNLYMLFFAVVSVKALDHEDLDIDILLSDSNHFENIVNCFLDKVPCDDVAASLKSDLPVVVESSCDRCTPKEKHIVKAFIDAFNQAPKLFKDFKAKYDPKRIYLSNLEAAVAAF